MKTSREQVLELVAAGKVSPDEADAMLSAMSRPKGSAWEWVFNPMERLSMPVALGLSTALCALSMMLSRWNIRLYSPLQVELSPGPVTWAQAALDAVASWPLAAAIFWGVARLSFRRSRFVDFLAAFGLARAPFVLSGFVTLGLDLPRDDLAALKHAVSQPSFLLALFGLLFLLGWGITLSVLGFRTASGLRGGKLVVSFIAGLLLAEILARVLNAVL